MIWNLFFWITSGQKQAPHSPDGFHFRLKIKYRHIEIEVKLRPRLINDDDNGASIWPGNVINITMIILTPPPWVENMGGQTNHQSACVPMASNHLSVVWKLFLFSLTLSVFFSIQRKKRHIGSYGVCFPGGGSPKSGGVCLVPGGGSPSRGGGLPGPGEGLSIWGGMASQHALRQTPPRGQTHTCKNITLATTSLRPVKIRL